VTADVATTLCVIGGVALFLVVLYLWLAFRTWRLVERQNRQRADEQRRRLEQRRAEELARKDRKGPR
jgi:flagellar biosynthesis/type III secretory pathway M-ring protein FliF/YscJ